jgi:polyhydroxybutyrate depolymerase
LDPLVPLAGGKVDTPWGKKIYKPPVTESLRRWRVLLGCPAEPAWVQEVEGVMMEHFGPGRNGSCLETWMIAGLGHHWPGGKGGLKTSIAGPPSDRVVATESIWQFFKQFSLP